ncbi:MAG TPA: glycosyltransferase family 4 protein [Gemmatimonadales bacterium]|nr:glycosyltransferase family 4 protein [Gemmatimonadales bacterium]
MTAGDGPSPPSLLLAFNFPPHEGGIARMMGELARRYPPYSLVISTGSYDESAASDATFQQTIDRVAVPAQRLRAVPGLLRWTARADRLARRTQPRFAWCAELKPAAYPARWLHTRYGIPFGIITYGAELLLLDQKLRRSRFKRRTGGWLLEGASVFVAISEWTAAYTQRLLSEVGLTEAAQRVRVVPLGTDPDQFQVGIDTAAVRRAYGLHGGPWILTVARLDWHKGFDTVIRALPAVRAMHPEARYAIAGVGASRPYLEALVAELRLGDAVRFLGFVPDADLPAVYNVADVFALVSRRHDLLVEGFGIAAVEASACGVPVVAGREGGLGDAVRDGETGLLVDPYDPLDVAAALQRLLSDAALRRRLGQAGRAAVETYYNWNRVARDFENIEAELRRHDAGVLSPSPR